ncbi:hypothetical protein SAMN05518865_1124 [Duganella sp. CF458]|uniref:hypothetical protein n=1 Tax=Duganella sp. CF458 TaxID=1884368 RepID=UPI0008E021D8|nr:hypothetical protein [Duganella sp. CF458]SFG42726.1 hypothetical protein SAMN05518865_1124 [Duganella sp. CF458]
MIEDCLPIVEEVKEWKYSKKQYFTPLPFENELGGYSRGNIIKRKYESFDEALLNGNYAFGFIQDHHRITIAPAPTPNSPWEVSLHSVIGDEIRIKHSVHHRRLPKPSELRGICDLFPIDSQTKASVGVGDRGAFYVYCYIYNDAGLIDAVRAFSKGWLQEADYRLHYGIDGAMRKITIGNSIIWEAT